MFLCCSLQVLSTARQSAAVRPGRCRASAPTCSSRRCGRPRLPGARRPRLRPRATHQPRQQPQRLPTPASPAASAESSSSLRLCRSRTVLQRQPQCRAPTAASKPARARPRRPPPQSQPPALRPRPNPHAHCHRWRTHPGACSLRRLPNVSSRSQTHCSLPTPPCTTENPRWKSEATPLTKTRTGSFQLGT